MADNTLYYGDDLDILRRYIRDERVDIGRLEPIFNDEADGSGLRAKHFTA